MDEKKEVTFCSQQAVDRLFEVVNESAATWLLLRNTNDELPARLPREKDIDVLVQFSGRDRIAESLAKAGYRRIKHPARNDVRLYGVHAFEMYHKSEGAYLDVNFEIAVRSLDRGQWIPLDQIIQSSAWENRVFDDLGSQRVPRLGNEDLFVTTVARCVFDKRVFSPWHRAKLSELWSICNKDAVMQRLERVFFKYSNILVRHVESNSYDRIVSDYLAFSDY